MYDFVLFVNVLTRAQTSLHSSTHKQWRNTLIVEEQHSSKYVHIFACKQKDKWDKWDIIIILPSIIYTKDNSDSLTLLSTGHLSYSSATTHCNHSIRLLIIGDPSSRLILCRPQRPFERDNFNSIESNCSRTN